MGNDYFQQVTECSVYIKDSQREQCGSDHYKSHDNSKVDIARTPPCHRHTGDLPALNITPYVVEVDTPNITCAGVNTPNANAESLNSTFSALSVTLNSVAFDLSETPNPNNLFTPDLSILTTEDSDLDSDSDDLLHTQGISSSPHGILTPDVCLDTSFLLNDSPFHMLYQPQNHLLEIFHLMIPLKGSLVMHTRY